MIDASEGFIKDGPKNRLREMDVHRIVDAYQQGGDIAGYARFVPMAEVLEQDYNLNLPRYIASNKAEDVQDIDAHLNGGMQAMLMRLVIIGRNLLALVRCFFLLKERGICPLMWQRMR